MKKLILIAGAALAVTGCASTNTVGNWQCRAKVKGTCASIEQIDAAESIGPSAKGKGAKDGPLAFGTRPSRWWETQFPTAETREGDPLHASDQVMRILIAPWIDNQGDYHARSEIFAVVHKADWWAQRPVPIAAEPKTGTSLPVGNADKDAAPARN